MTNYISSSAAKALFLALPICYFFAYGPFGLDDIDGGFITGLAWRIQQGDLPYKDFIYVRPPISPYLHSISLMLLPDSLQLIFERFLCYVFIATYSYLAIDAINRAFSFDESGTNKYLLAALSFVFSAHNFPPMPWHTVDGIFLSVLGMNILSRSQGQWYLASGMLFSLAAALCKQSFYLVPVAAVCFIGLAYGWKKLLLAAAFLITQVCILFAILSYAGILSEFLQSIRGQTKLEDLLNAGVYSYRDANQPLLALLLGLLAAGGLLKIAKKDKYLPFLGLGLMAWFIYILAETIKECLQRQQFIGPVVNWPSVLLLFALLVVFVEICRKRILPAAILLYCLVVSWSSSISWGYISPVLFSAPLAFASVYVVREYWCFNRISLFQSLLLIPALFTYNIAYDFPYSSKKKSLLIYDMGEVFPKLSFIRSDRDTYEKYQELKSLTGKYGTNFKTLPDLPLSNFLTDSHSPLPLDWPLNAEANQSAEVLLRDLERTGAVVFMNKATLSGLREAGTSRFGSLMTVMVADRWEKIESGRYFDTYKPPQNALSRK